MLINSPIINDANLMNSISSKSFYEANKGLIIDRGVMISNYNQKTIDACWEALSTNIIQNYQKGKGTYIKNFGVFTYKAEEVNLEGTTNQYIRDKKPKVPVFIVSKEYNRNLAAGEYTKQNGIRYFTQKENKDISLLKLNYAQIAYSISMSKDEVVNLINNLISYMMESIVQKTFESKILPGLGTFVVRGNILAVKFNDVFVIKNKFKNNTNTFTKKNIFMDMDMDNAQDVMANECLNPLDNIEYLKATNSLITNVEKSAKDYLKLNYNTDVKKYPQHEVKSIHKDINKNLDGSFKFINDDKKIKFNKTNFMKKKSIDNIPLGFLDEETLKSLEYFKGMMIKNCKSFDLSRSGTIIKEDAIKALMKTNINNKIDYNVAKNIIDYYNKTENVEYMKFIAQLIKDSHLTLLKKYSKDNSNLNNIDFNYFKRENNFIKINNNILYKSNGFNNDNNKKFLSQDRKIKIKKAIHVVLKKRKSQKIKKLKQVCQMDLV
jgi:nucleoid DNA-binding protein